MMPVNIIEAYFVSAENIMALAHIDGDDRWLSYCPSNSDNSHCKIRTAQLDGTLTGKTTPDAYVAPTPIPEPTPQEKRAAAYAVDCDPILVQIDGYKLENEINGDNGKDARITELKALWKSKRDAIRALYPDA